MISRKKFLHLAGLGIVSSLAPNFLFANSFESSTTDDVSAILKVARRLRKQGRLNAAKAKYEQILTIDASEIRAYNGIRKILLAKKNKELQVIQLYQQAATYMPTEGRFKQRLYNQYAKAALGNKKIISQLNIPNTRPLLFVKQKYEEMLVLQNCANKKNLEKELAKINKYIALNVDVSDVRKNKELKKFRRDNRNAHKKRFSHLTAQETTVALVNLKAKNSSIDRIPQIREMSKVNIAAYRLEKNYVAALAASKDFLNTIDKSDPYFIKQFRELSKQLNGYDDLISFEGSRSKVGD